MNTNIMKERIKVKHSLLDNFHQELNLYDVVIVYQYGSMRPAIISKINEDQSIRLDISQKRYYPRELVLANNILSKEEIQKYVKKFLDNKAAKEAAIKQKITYKYIFGYWKNIKTNKAGIFLMNIPSCPGKTVTKKNIKSSIEKLQEFLNKNKQYKIQFLINNPIEDFKMSGDLLKANVYTESSLATYMSFIVDSTKYQKNYSENPITGQEEFEDFINKDYIFLIVEEKTKIAKKFQNSCQLNFSTNSMNENIIFYKIINGNKTYGFAQHLYQHKKIFQEFLNTNNKNNNK